MSTPQGPGHGGAHRDLQSPAQRIKAVQGDERLDLRRSVSIDHRSLLVSAGDNTLVRSSSAPTFKRETTGSADTGLVRTSSAQRIMMDRQRRGSLNLEQGPRNPLVNDMIVCSPLSLGSPEQRLGMSAVAAMIASSSPPSPPTATIRSEPPSEEKKPKKKKKKKESYKDMMAAMTVISPAP